MRTLAIVAVAACASRAPQPPPIANAGDRPHPPTWCDDVLANRLDRAGRLLRPLLEARPFDKDAVFAFLRAQPCVDGRIVTDTSIADSMSGTGVIVDIPRAGVAKLRCKAMLERDETGRTTFTIGCNPR